jgi:hypothetical protein
MRILVVDHGFMHRRVEGLAFSADTFDAEATQGIQESFAS